MTPNTLLVPSSRQRGSFLLEALIAILIVALGVLGSVGLLARSMQDVDDAKYRGEAAYLANSLIGAMWIDDRATANLAIKYSKLGGGPGFVEFSALVAQRMPQAKLGSLDVTVDPGPTATSSIVTVTIVWLPPGDKPGAPDHRVVTSATIGANQ